jgi:hypothetical protein
MSGDHNMRGEDDDEISTSTHFLPKPKTYGCDQNEFSPDWDQMAVLVTHSQEQAAKIEQLEKQVRDIQVTAIAEATEVDRLREALEQPEQEPVAYYHPYKGFYWAKPTHISAPTVVDVPPVPLYVKWIAAQRPWVGLTDTEIDYQAKKDDHGVYFALGALWAEAKLKERNT